RRGLARAVGADESTHLAGAEREREPIDGHEPAELFGEPARLEQPAVRGAGRARHTRGSHCWTTAAGARAVRAAGRRRAAVRAAGPPGSRGPQARGEQYEGAPPAEARR